MFAPFTAASTATETIDQDGFTWSRHLFFSSSELLSNVTNVNSVQLILVTLALVSTATAGITVNLAINSTLPEGTTLQNSAFLCHWACILTSDADSQCDTVATTGTADPDCLCKDAGAQAGFVACIEKQCPAKKDEVVAFNKVLCDAGAPIQKACGADADTKGECACTSQPVQDSLDQCLTKTCPALVDTARAVRKMYCPLGGTSFSIGGSGDFNVSIPDDAAPNTTTGSQPSEETSAPTGTGDPPGNSASPLSRTGLAAVTLFIAAIASVLV